MCSKRRGHWRFTGAWFIRSVKPLFIASPNRTALHWAIDSVRKGGTVSVMGAYGPMFSAVRFGDAMNKGLTLRMNQAPVKRQWPRLFEHIRAGYLRPSDLVTHRIPLDHIAEGYHLFSTKLDDIIKPVIVPAP